MSDGSAGGPWRRWAPVPVRFVVGYGFMVHGWAKLGRGPAGFAKLLAWMGVPFPTPTAWTAVLLELLGGLAVFLGAFVEVVSLPLIGMMLVAMFTIHLRYGFSSINTTGLTESGPQFGPPGYEVNLLYVGAMLSLVVGGAGALSVDALLGRRRSPAPTSRARRVASG
jgi:putative oxidoreductase